MSSGSLENKIRLQEKTKKKVSLAADVRREGVQPQRDAAGLTKVEAGVAGYSPQPLVGAGRAAAAGARPFAAYLLSERNRGPALGDRLCRRRARSGGRTSAGLGGTIPATRRVGRSAEGPSQLRSPGRGGAPPSPKKEGDSSRQRAPTEARTGFEPVIFGLRDRRLTTWPPRLR
ncbi:uncharacterized protein ACIQIH_014065 isoform 1-T3 [Cyanocitta cristata]